jgi:hypothetical protein
MYQPVQSRNSISQSLIAMRMCVILIFSFALACVAAAQMSPPNRKGRSAGQFSQPHGFSQPQGHGSRQASDHRQTNDRKQANDRKQTNDRKQASDRKQANGTDEQPSSGKQTRAGKGKSTTTPEPASNAADATGKSAVPATTPIPPATVGSQGSTGPATPTSNQTITTPSDGNGSAASGAPIISNKTITPLSNGNGSAAGGAPNISNNTITTPSNGNGSAASGAPIISNKTITPPSNGNGSTAGGAPSTSNQTITVPTQQGAGISVEPTSNQPTAPVSAVPVPNQPTLSTNPNPTQATQQLSVGAGPNQPTAPVSVPAASNQAAERPPIVPQVTQLPTPNQAVSAPAANIIIPTQQGAAVSGAISADPTTNQPTQQGSGTSVNSSNSITTQGQIGIITEPTQTRDTTVPLQVTGGEQIGVVQPSSFKPVTVTDPNPGLITLPGEHTDVQSLGPPNTSLPYNEGYLDMHALQRQIVGAPILPGPDAANSLNNQQTNPNAYSDAYGDK